ncbi:putative outer membrane starch-binding protein [Dyadobacter jejuensis]|uniref:Putative outer membrane starch-binding protein n=1 Tax=Dyadobacter jejuensis TaxID=1082580 RepID=A0A316AK68_9BACT|nr:RagB/SusD family nutrient uptake outer membrane protein [Dyadobacter jejuensis]PWJ57669.1 putative outer membrane starch-binding protein [Dyadobacter jejuensis]
MKKHSYIVLIVLLTGLMACDEDFLNRYPQTEIAPEAFFNNEEDLALYINGLLSMPDRYTYLSEQNTDNAATTGAVEMKTIMTASPTAQNITSGWNWSRLRNINYFLDNYQKANSSQEVKDHFAGLARYYRARFYMDMVKRYSDVPWYSTAINPDDETLYKTQDPRAVVMDSVMADLAFASAHVREAVPSGTPNKWAVKTEEARIALYEGTYRKYHDELNLQGTAQAFLERAAKVSQEIITSGKFDIFSSGNPHQDYASLFNAQDLLTNKEVILANAFDQNKNRSQDINSVVFGEYEQSPARDLVQTYLMADGSRFTDQPGYKTFGFIQEFEKRDPRLSQTLVYPGWIRQPNTSPYILRLNKNFTGYHQLKGYANTTEAAINNGIDFPVYRYAEVLLILAEAKAELNTLTQTDLDGTVNLLRSRVGLPQLSMATANALPDPFLTKKYPNVTGANLGVLLEIRRERRVEFAFEGKRFDDLMRWKVGTLLTNIPEGLYFPGLGKYDMSGDGIPDIILVGKEVTIPEEADKEKNSLGLSLIYYKTGVIGEDVTVYLKNGAQGGTTVTETTPRTFQEPKFYYRPVPQQQVILNPNLKQIFGW